MTAYHVQSGGTIGEGGDSASTYPVPPPDAVAVSGATSADGEFSLTLPDSRPVLLVARGGSYLESVSGQIRQLGPGEELTAVVAVAGTDRVRISPLSTLSTRLALAKARGGIPVTEAIDSANKSLATLFRLDDLLNPKDTSDLNDFEGLLAALHVWAQDVEVEDSSLREALARDIIDGVFDGLDGQETLFVRPLSNQGSATELLPLTSVSSTTLLKKWKDSTPSPSSELAASLDSSSGVVAAVPPDYVSPYSVVFQCDESALSADFSIPPRSEVSQESFDPVFDRWFSVSTYPKSQLPWGPVARVYPAPTVPSDCDPVVWRRERVLASALKRIGTHYQHHHIPDWDPSPFNWPQWMPVSLGHNSAGIDCSNFSSWNYNFGLGIKLDTGVSAQAANTTINEPGNGSVQAQVLLQASDSNPVDYATIKSTLRTGDLLYIRGQSKGAPGEGITHVIMWVGSVGRGPDDTPLIIDSHDNSPKVNDANGVLIPSGVQLRPFREGSWYHTAFDHAHRIVR